MTEFITPRKRPRITTGDTTKQATGCGNLYVTVNRDEHGICEIFSTLGHTGQCGAAQMEALSRMLSMALRSGINPEVLVDELRGIQCPSPMNVGGKFEALSCADAIARVLAEKLGIEIKPSEPRKGIDNA